MIALWSICDLGHVSYQLLKPLTDSPFSFFQCLSLFTIDRLQLNASVAREWCLYLLNMVHTIFPLRNSLIHHIKYPISVKLEISFLLEGSLIDISTVIVAPRTFTSIQQLASFPSQGGRPITNQGCRSWLSHRAPFEGHDRIKYNSLCAINSS